CVSHRFQYVLISSLVLDVRIHRSIVTMFVHFERYSLSHRSERYSMSRVKAELISHRYRRSISTNHHHHYLLATVIESHHFASVNRLQLADFSCGYPAFDGSNP
uniref:Uncharacterized protein n=1 Tax=Parascaris univalens TaxID=6257 RepID=A0A915CCJ1_PARUN